MDGSRGYGPVLDRWLKVAAPMPLGPAMPDELARSESIDGTGAFAHGSVVDMEMARCCVAGVLLLHNDLVASHILSQGIDTVEGSYWHAIMHRREPDYPNAKYWLRRVGRHTIFEQIAQQTGGSWDPLEFVDDVQQALCGDGALLAECQRIQMIEFQLLFDYCYQRAVAS